MNGYINWFLIIFWAFYIAAALSIFGVIFILWRGLMFAICIQRGHEWTRVFDGDRNWELRCRRCKTWAEEWR